ncbi:MAG TPA: hypothetical protein QKA34_06140 [Candidatus Megaira endosymbiont of Mesostigma viride]|nr:hypothetical protein [Candidatus Megaira endosymbiont of Mesostigma viride]
MIKCFMGNNKEDYFEYIDIITGTIRRKRTGLFPRDNENIFIADNNITIPKSVKDKLGDKIQNALPISSEKFHYSTKTSLQSPSEHNIQAPEYFPNEENFSLSPADTLAPITFLDSKAKLTEGKQLIVKNNESLSDDSIVTVDIPETAIITQRHVKEKLQIIKDTADSGKGNGFQEITTEVERQILAEVEKETIEPDEENLLQKQLTQRLAREEEKERQLLDAEDLGGLEEQRVGVGNLDLEVAEERHVQELEPPLEEEERQRLELREEPAVEYIEPHLEEEDDRQLLDAEDLGGLEEQRVGVGNLDLEVVEERHVQELEPHLEEEERQRLELREEVAVEYIEPHLEEEDDRQLLDAEDLGELEEQRVGVGNLDLEVVEERHVQELEPPLEEEERQRLELEQRLARKEEEARLERERIAREEEEERVKQQKLKEYYDKYNADVLARVERQKREEERQKQLQKFKEYQEQQVREVLIQLEHKKQLEKLRLTEVLDKLKEGVVSLELANKQATKLLPGGFFFKEHLLVREAKKQLGLQKVALENGVIPGLEKLEELEELVIGITRTAEVITQETQRLRQVEAVKARIKVEHTIKKPLEVAEKKSWLEQIKYKLSCCFSANDHEPKPKMIEMVSMHTNVQDEEISVDSIGEQVTVNSSVEIV